jgi:hypothetical protein
MKRPGAGGLVIIMAVLAICGVGLGFWGVQGINLSREDGDQSREIEKNSALDTDGHMELRGAEMSKMIQGKPAYRVDINNIRVVNKKVGFLSIGGLRQIEIDGLRLDLYREGIDDLRAGHASDAQDGRSKAVRGGDIFESIFTSMSLGENNLDSVAGLQGHHVQLCFWEEMERVFRLYAGNMKYDPAKKAVEFTDHVRVYVYDQAYEVQKARLHTAQLTLTTSAGQCFDLRRMKMAAKRPGPGRKHSSWW